MISDVAKSISSNSHIEKSVTTGKAGELNFVKACRLSGIRVDNSTQDENIHNHIDFYIDGKGVDVKGYKDSHKRGEVVVEFRNVNGKDGSCSNSAMSEFIAFQFSDHFLIVRTKELLIYCRSNVKNIRVDNFKDCYKKLYTRRNRKDLMTKLKVSDLYELNYILKIKF